MASPLDIRPRPVYTGPRLAYRTSTGDKPRASTKPALDCPGCSGEASKRVGVMLGCTICPL